jgi:hypothetical protein
MLQSYKTVIYNNGVITPLSPSGRRNVVFAEQRILETIRNYEPEGRRLLDIANDIHKHRDTARRLCNRLQRDHYITRRNKQSPYHVTDKANGDPADTAVFFQRQALENILSWKWLSLTNNFCDKDHCKNILNDPEQRLGRSDQLTLFEFANRVGALIVYSMVQACRPKKPELNINNIRIGINLKGVDKEKIARSWTNSLSGDRIFSEFSKMDLVKKSLSRYNPTPYNRQETKKAAIQDFINSLPEKDRANIRRCIPSKVWSENFLNVHEIDRESFYILIRILKDQYSHIYRQLEQWLDDIEIKYAYMKKRQFDPNNPSWSDYEMHEDDFARLNKAYAALYPDIYKDLDNIRKSVIKKIEKTRAIIHDPDHTKCGGQQVPDYIANTITKEGKLEKRVKLKKCLRCGRLISVDEILRE